MRTRKMFLSIAVMAITLAIIAICGAAAIAIAYSNMVESIRFPLTFVAGAAAFRLFIFFIEVFNQTFRRK